MIYLSYGSMSSSTRDKHTPSSPAGSASNQSVFIPAAINAVTNSNNNNTTLKLGIDCPKPSPATHAPRPSCRMVSDLFSSFLSLWSIAPRPSTADESESGSESDGDGERLRGSRPHSHTGKTSKPTTWVCIPH